MGSIKQSEQQRRKLKSLTVEQLNELMFDKDIRWFHNGGQRQRCVIGGGMWVTYTTSAKAHRSTAIFPSVFAQWAKGYVDGDKMYVLGEDGAYVEYEPATE